jgi:Protein of unknown function (DUF3592)
MLHWRLGSKRPRLTAAASREGNVLASAEELVSRLTNNRAKLLRYAFIPQAIAGLFLLALSYFMGYAHFRLIREGVRAPGRIVGYKQENFRRSSESFSTTGYMPIVEFHTNDRFVQFQDWLGTRIAGSANLPVIVLYDPANPAIAMIDRPLGNWLPWAPIFVVGLFLLLVSIKGALHSLHS